MSEQKRYLSKKGLFAVFILFVPWMWYLIAEMSNVQTRMKFSRYVQPKNQHYYATHTQVKKQNGTKPFNGILLAINFNHPHYTNIEILLQYYSDLFSKIVFCGPEKFNQHDVFVIEGEKGWYGYACLAYAIKYNPGQDGYMYVNDDMVVNWWTMVDLPKQKIWSGKDIKNEHGAEMDKPVPCCWHWWRTASALERCKQSFDALYHSQNRWNGEINMKIYFSNTNGTRLCLKEWSDFMYLPARVAAAYVKIAEQFYRDRVFLEVAVATTITMLDKAENRINVDGVYLPDKFGDIDFSSGVQFASVYDTKRSFYHPVKFAADKGISRNIFTNVVMEYSKQYMKYLQTTA